MKGNYQSRWASLGQIHLPSSIVTDGTIALNRDALKVLVALAYGYMASRPKIDDPSVSVKIGQARLMERTGYKRAATITKATQALTSLKYIKADPQRRGTKGNGSHPTRYTLLRPDTGQPLVWKMKQNTLYSNSIPYITYPKVVFKESAQPWSLARMSPSAHVVYVAALWLANRVNLNTFSTTKLEWRTVSGLSLVTFKKSVEELQTLGLIRLGKETPKGVEIHLCDPYTGEPLHTPTGIEEDNPSNYSLLDSKGTSRRLLLTGHTHSQVEDLIQSCLPPGQTMEKSADSIRILCPYHDDHNPSLHITISKRLFHCFSCDAGGSLRQLVAKLKGSNAAAIVTLAKAKGQEADYKRPDCEAAAIYDYNNENFRLLKQVLRYPNGPNGEKNFKQRRPKPGGWMWNTTGLKPLMYNAEWLQIARTVIICEGEKDAKRVNDLDLGGGGYRTAAVTSGGAESWDPSLATMLVGKRVIILPDDDAAGARYADAIRTSLDAADVTYRECSFAGTGVKDASAFLDKFSTAGLVKLLGEDWVEPAGGVPSVEDELFTPV